MFTSKLAFFRKSAPAAPVAEPAPEVQTFRRDFNLNLETMTVKEVLNDLRNRTIQFSDDFDLTSATTKFRFYDVKITVKLTESQDIIYSVNGQKTTNLREAEQMIYTQKIQF